MHGFGSGQGGGGRGGGGGGAAGPPGPIMKLAEMIGVDGRFVTIPGALGVQANQVPVIYLMIAALMVRQRARSAAIACVCPLELMLLRAAWPSLSG